jgi:hypothetical protein
MRFTERLIYEQLAAQAGPGLPQNRRAWSRQLLKIDQQLLIISFLFHLLYQLLRFATLPTTPLWTPPGKPGSGF